MRDLYAEQRSSSSLDGRQVLSFDFQRAKGGSDVSVFEGARLKLLALEKRNPQVRFQLIDDETKYAKAQYKSAIEAMIASAGATTDRSPPGPASVAP